MQSIETIHRYAVKVVNRSRRDNDVYRHLPIHRLIRRRRGVDFHIVITTRLIICLYSPWDIGDTRIRVRLLQEIGHLSTQCFRIVNRPPAKRSNAKKILSSFVDRDNYSHLVALLMKDVTGLIDNGLHKSYSAIQVVAE